MKAILTLLTFFTNAINILSSYKGKYVKELWIVIGFIIMITSIGAVVGHTDARDECVARCNPDRAVSYSVFHCECQIVPKPASSE